MKDVNLISNVALPNAGNTVNTNAIALPQNGNRPFLPGLRVRFETTQSTGANSKNINVVLQASNEANANFANIAELASMRVAGNAANYPAANREVYLPPNLNKSYVRAQATGEADGGNASDGVLSLQFVD